MGAVLSSKSKGSETYEVQQGQASKRQRTTSSNFCDDNPRLIPALPDEISIQILARIPRGCYFNVRLVSRRWKAAIMSSEIYKVRKELGTTEEWLYILTKVENEKFMWYALDPLSGIWQRLPPMPKVVGEEEGKRGLTGLKMWNIVGSTIRVSDSIRGWLGRKDTQDRMPFCGCAVAAVGGSIYVLGGFSKATAMSTVWRFDPVLNRWSAAASMSTGRAYCKTGTLNDKLYVVGGVTKDRGGLAPLQSAEVYDPCTGLWTQLPSMPFSKTHMLPTAVLVDRLKPIATGMTSYRGKLYVAQSLYCWPFFVDVGGEVYDPETNQWAAMTTAMGEGWPARQAGTKLSVIVDGDLYALDPSRTLDSAKIKLYDHERDAWKVVAGDVPIRDFTESESPYLLSGCLGKLHVITKDMSGDIAVMQAERRRSNAGPSSSGSSAESSNLGGSESIFWKVIASRGGGAEELVSCQILDI